MKIGLISDTHGSVMAWENGLYMLAESDIFVHGGDILYHGPRNPLPEQYDPHTLSETLNRFEAPLFLIKGNCDAAVDEMVLDLPLISPFFYTKLDDLNFLALHGDGYNEEDMFQLGKAYDAQVVMFGHIHMPLLKQDDNGIILVNPGSPAIPKGEQPRPTAAMIETAKKQVEIYDLATGDTIDKIDNGW